jgi:hypothetical protein
VLARVALVGRLLREPLVRDAFDTWATRHGLREPLETLTTRLAGIATDAGLGSRTALWSPESLQDVSTQQAVHEAYEAFRNGLAGSGVELILDSGRLADQLATALKLPEGCVPWLALELFSWFFDSLRGEIENRPVLRRYSEEPFPVTVQIDPRMSARERSRAMQQQVATQLRASREQSTGKKMPTRGGLHITNYVNWLVDHGLHRVSVMVLARALLRSERDVPRSFNYDAHRRVQYGISQARTWLAAVARIPSSRPPQPERQPTRKRSTRGRRRRSPPR